MTRASNDSIVLNGDDSGKESNGTSYHQNDRITALESNFSSMQAFNRGMTNTMDSLKNQFTQSKNDLSNEINFLAVSSLLWSMFELPSRLGHEIPVSITTMADDNNLLPINIRHGKIRFNQFRKT